MVTLGINDTALAALLADPASDPAKHAEYAAIEAMRLAELELITTGDAACVSVHPGEHGYGSHVPAAPGTTWFGFLNFECAIILPSQQVVVLVVQEPGNFLI